MEKIINCSYDKDADELNIYLGKPRFSILSEIGEEIYVKLSPKTKEIIGFTILHFEKRSLAKEKGEVFSIPLQADFKFTPTSRKLALATI